MSNMCVLLISMMWSMMLHSATGKHPASAQQSKKDSVMTEITLHVGKSVFTATLYDNPSAKALLIKLPLSIAMEELNDNEKYYFFPDKLPARANNPGTIEAGDLMLYGNNCLVLFYETFRTDYTYTQLGRIKNVKGLAAALGSGEINITIDKK